MFDGERGPLEGIFMAPDTPGPHPAIVVCHPHPRYGGSMDNNVVMAICFGSYQRGIASLRFNFRGVGLSKGRYENGVGEQEDIRAALAFLAQHEGIDPEHLGLAGYSFGARVAMTMAESASQVQALCLVSPPMRDPGTALAAFARPKLLVVGDRDDGIPVEAVAAFASGIPDPTDIQVVPGADHFWYGYEEELDRRVGEFFARSLSRSPA